MSAAGEIVTPARDSHSGCARTNNISSRADPPTVRDPLSSMESGAVGGSTRGP